VRVDGTVIPALALVRDPNVRASSLALVAVGATIDPAHRVVVLGTTTPLTHPIVLRACKNSFLTDPAHRAVVVVVTEPMLRNAFPGFAYVPRGAVDQRAQIHAHSWRLRRQNVGVRMVGRPDVVALTVVAGGAVAVVVALPGVRLSQDSAGELEIAERRHHRESLEQRLLTVTEEKPFALIRVAEHRWLQ
jgi:hypothetical protein